MPTREPIEPEFGNRTIHCQTCKVRGGHAPDCPALQAFKLLNHPNSWGKYDDWNEQTGMSYNPVFGTPSENAKAIAESPQPTAQAGEAEHHCSQCDGVFCYGSGLAPKVPAPPTPSSAGEAPIVDFRGWTWDAENRDWVAPASPHLPTPELGKAINTIARYLPDLITAVEALSSELKLSRADSTAAKPNPKSEEQESAQ